MPTLTLGATLMGFLSAYDGTFKVHIPHPDKDYWVELRKHLTHGATEKAVQVLQNVTVVNGQPHARPDVWRSQSERVIASIIAWNLDDDNGTVWPVNLQNLRRLPEEVFDQLHSAVEEANKAPSVEERQRFRGAGVGGGPDGDAGAAEPVDVPDGAAAVAAPGFEA